MLSVETIGMTLIDAAAMIVGLIVMTRIAGLRAFSKLSGYDFPITVAMGSVMASVVVSPSTGFGMGWLALAALFGVQMCLSYVRIKSDPVQEAMDNAPLLIMRGSQMFDDNMKKAKVTRSDLFAKLREANVTHLDQVHAVVFEQTGDVSVLHGDGDLQDALLEGVRDA